MRLDYKRIGMLSITGKSYGRVGLINRLGQRTKERVAEEQEGSRSGRVCAYKKFV